MAPILTRLGQAFGFGASAGGGADAGSPIEATGGTTLSPFLAPDGKYYKVHYWAGEGDYPGPTTGFQVTALATGSWPNKLEYLVIGGGGGGGAGRGGGGGAGGGGAGGVHTNIGTAGGYSMPQSWSYGFYPTDYAAPGYDYPWVAKSGPEGKYDIKVGYKGAGGAGDRGNDGSKSHIGPPTAGPPSAIVVARGGGGGGGDGSYNGRNGGSGGGGCGGTGSMRDGGTAGLDPTAALQPTELGGNSGYKGTGPDNAAGGGGGAGTAGGPTVPSPSPMGWNGGLGAYIYFGGPPTNNGLPYGPATTHGVGGGGGGGTASNPQTSSGVNGGGSGDNGPGQDAAANTGGGGAGGGTGGGKPGGDGGEGLVAIRYHVAA